LVSDLFLLAGSRSDGYGKKGGELTEERDRLRGLAALVFNGEVVLGVPDDGETRNIFQLEVAETIAKRHPRILPAAVLKGDWKLGLWRWCRERGEKRWLPEISRNGGHTSEAKDRGVLGGEVCRGEVYWSFGNSLPKF
jgi:hypothetical protein